MEPGKVQEAAIHNIESACFQRDDVQDVDPVEFAVGDVNKARYIAPQIQERMETDGPFCFTEACLGKDGQAQVHVFKSRTDINDIFYKICYTVTKLNHQLFRTVVIKSD